MGKNKAAVALGRKGGKARKKKLNAEQRSAIARKAGLASGKARRQTKVINAILSKSPNSKLLRAARKAGKIRPAISNAFAAAAAATVTALAQRPVRLNTALIDEFDKFSKAHKKKAAEPKPGRP